MPRINIDGPWTRDANPGEEEVFVHAELDAVHRNLRAIDVDHHLVLWRNVAREQLLFDDLVEGVVRVELIAVGSVRIFQAIDGDPCRIAAWTDASLNLH